MNYIKEINAFYQRQEADPVSAHAANLWHTLMHINNRTGWKKEFTVAVAVLCFKGSLSNSSFKRARTELQERGYIHVESRRGNQSAKYRMMSLVISHGDGSDDSKGEQQVDCEAVQVVDQNEAQKEQTSLFERSNFEQKVLVSSEKRVDVNHKVAPLVKQKETKQRTTTTATCAIHFFQHNFGMMSPYLQQELMKWTNEVGESLVVTAMKRAMERGKGNWGYCKGILRAWLEKGIQSVQQAEVEVLAWKNKYHRKSLATAGTPATTSSVAQEVLPDWFKERKNKRAGAESRWEKESDSVADAKKRAELERIIAKYASSCITF